jgi:predicted PurR-regulated permease PerM
MIPFAVSALSRVIGGGFAIVNALTLVVVTPIAAFYLLRDWPRLVAKADAILPHRYAGVIRAQVVEVDRILSAWLRGQLLCCLMLAAFYAIGLTVVGLDLGLIVGLTAGLISFIPYVGTITGAVTSISLAIAQFPDWNGVFLVAGVFVLGQILEGYVIYPRLLGNRVELHDVLVIFALLAGGAAFGFLGVLLAVPVTAALGVLARFGSGGICRARSISIRRPTAIGSSHDRRGRRFRPAARPAFCLRSAFSRGRLHRRPVE